MRKFAVIVEDMSMKEEEAFVEFCKEHQVGWWHWFDSLWLITDASGSVSVSHIRDNIRSITNGKPCIVLAVREAGSWAGTAKPGVKDKMFEWIKVNWFTSKR